MGVLYNKKLPSRKLMGDKFSDSNLNYLTQVLSKFDLLPQLL